VTHAGIVSSVGRRGYLRHRAIRMRWLLAFALIATSPLWSVPASSSSASPMSAGEAEQLAMATVSRGLLLMGNTTGTKCFVFVSATNNGARSFSPPVRVGEGSCRQENERLVVGSTGVSLAFGMVTAVSDNWGVTWKPINVGGPVVGASISGDSVWASRLSCTSSTSDQCPLLIYMSTDGGKNWRKTNTQPGGARAWRGPASVLATTILFQSPKVGYVFSAPTTQLRPIHNIEEWSTFNGGKSWNPGVVRCAQGVFNGLVVSKLTSGALLALCAGQPFNGYQAKSVSISNNRGMDWTAEPSNGLGSKFVVGYADSIAGPTGQTMYEFGQEGPLHVSHDGGVYWTDLATFGVAPNVPSSVQFVNSKNGFALGATESSKSVQLTIWTTEDAGRHWTSHIISSKKTAG
jgi:hypothetical protein